MEENKMKKFLALMLAMIMALSLVACGEKETPVQPETTEPQPEQQEEAVLTTVTPAS